MVKNYSREFLCSHERPIKLKLYPVYKKTTIWNFIVWSTSKNGNSEYFPQVGDHLAPTPIREFWPDFTGFYCYFVAVSPEKMVNNKKWKWYLHNFFLSFNIHTFSRFFNASLNIPMPSQNPYRVCRSEHLMVDAPPNQSFLHNSSSLGRKPPLLAKLFPPFCSSAFCKKRLNLNTSDICLDVI